MIERYPDIEDWGATSIRRTFKSSKEFHISEYFHLVIFCGD